MRVKVISVSWNTSLEGDLKADLRFLEDRLMFF